MNLSPEVLLQRARCFTCIPEGRVRSVIIYLLTQWNEEEPIDADAQAFIDAAGLTNADQIAAVDALVVGLKGAGTPTYWSREVLIYPFIGGTAQAHAVNLKSPGTNNLTFGSAITHGTRGILGTMVDANSWADTGYIEAAPLTQNSARAFWYLDQDGNSGRFYFGAQNGPGWLRCQRTNSASGPISASINRFPDLGMGLGATSLLGAWLTQRRAAGQQEFGNRALAISAVAGASTGLPSGPTKFMLLTVNTGNPTPTLSLNARISAFTLGTPFASDAEWQEYRSIWETFQAALSRNIP